MLKRIRYAYILFKRYMAGHPYPSVCRSGPMCHVRGWNRRHKAFIRVGSWFSTSVLVSVFAVNVCKYTCIKHLVICLRNMITCDIFYLNQSNKKTTNTKTFPSVHDRSCLLNLTTGIYLF